MGELLSPVPPPSSLQGRESELTRIVALLDERRAPLVTLWGPGGIGKTSLATSTTHRVQAAMDAVLFVPLAHASDAAEVERTLAQSLSVSAPRTRSRDDVARRVGRALASHGRVLVVLDDVERVVAAAAEQVVALRGYAPMAQFLVTSRQPLGIRDEVLVEVTPLGLPLAGADAEDCDSVRLLLARARAVRPSFVATPDMLRSLARRTEGIPLAIELCAARLDVLSAEQLDERLARSRDVLRSPRRDVDARHRTLSAAIDVSYQLLDEDQRRALSQLSLVRGELELDTAEAIIHTGRPALDVLQELVRASLVVRRVRDDQVTFALFESVRAHAAQALAPDDDARLRHAQHFAEKGAQAASDVDGSDGARSLAALARMHDDLVAIVRGGGEHAPAALRALFPLYSVRGPIASFVELAASVAADRPTVRGVLGQALFATGQLEEARTVLTAAVDATKDDDERALLLCRLGDVVHEQGDHAAATELHRRALALAETRVDDALAGLCHAGIGTTAHVRGDLPTARRHYERALELLREAGHARGEARTLSKIGFLAVDEGRTAEARDHFEVSLALFRALADDRLSGYATGYLGNALRAEGKLDEAVARYAAAIETMRSVGDRLFEGVFRMDRGIALLLHDDLRPALDELETARMITAEVKNAYVEGLVLGYRVAALASLGELTRAVPAEIEARAACTGVTLECLELHARHLLVAAAGEGTDASLDETMAWLEAQEATPAANEHVRIARRLLRRALERVRPPATALVVDASARAVRPPHGESIELSGHDTLWRLVEAFVRARTDHPGEPLDARALLRAGWPDERVTRDAGAIRVRVAIAQLRKLGLRAVLLHRRGGYLLDPDTPVLEPRRRN